MVRIYLSIKLARRPNVNQAGKLDFLVPPNNKKGSPFGLPFLLLR